MKYRPYISTVLISMGIFISGCGGSGSGVGSFEVRAVHYNAGVTSPWSNASIYASAQNPRCNPVTDSNCPTQFTTTTGANGYTSPLATDALPGDWQATAYADSTCASGASSGSVAIQTGSTIVLTCGQNVQEAVASPNYYFYCITNQRPRPSSVTVTATKAIFSSSPLPQITSYDEQGNTKGGPTAALSVGGGGTTVSVPVNWPLTIAGNYIIAVRNPSTGATIAASIFTTDVYQPPAGCHQRSCYSC